VQQLAVAPDPAETALGPAHAAYRARRWRASRRARG
jgi:hypothetical protein